MTAFYDDIQVSGVSGRVEQNLPVVKGKGILLSKSTSTLQRGRSGPEQTEKEGLKGYTYNFQEVQIRLFLMRVKGIY